MKVVYSLEQAQEYFWHNLGVECVCVRFDGSEESLSLKEFALQQARGYSGLSDWEPDKLTRNEKNT